MSDDKFQVYHFDKEKAIKDLMEDLLQIMAMMLQMRPLI
jgi:hypothetical protein